MSVFKSFLLICALLYVVDPIGSAAIGTPPTTSSTTQEHSTTESNEALETIKKETAALITGSDTRTENARSLDIISSKRSSDLHNKLYDTNAEVNTEKDKPLTLLHHTSYRPPYELDNARLTTVANKLLEAIRHKSLYTRLEQDVQASPTTMVQMEKPDKSLLADERKNSTSNLDFVRYANVLQDGDGIREKGYKVYETEKNLSFESVYNQNEATTNHNHLKDDESEKSSSSRSTLTTPVTVITTKGTSTQKNEENIKSSEERTGKYEETTSETVFENNIYPILLPMATTTSGSRVFKKTLSPDIPPTSTGVHFENLYEITENDSDSDATSATLSILPTASAIGKETFYEMTDTEDTTANGENTDETSTNIVINFGETTIFGENEKDESSDSTIFTTDAATTILPQEVTSSGHKRTTLTSISTPSRSQSSLPTNTFSQTTDPTTLDSVITTLDVTQSSSFIGTTEITTIDQATEEQTTENNEEESSTTPVTIIPTIVSLKQTTIPTIPTTTQFTTTQEVAIKTITTTTTTESTTLTNYIPKDASLKTTVIGNELKKDTTRKPIMSNSSSSSSIESATEVIEEDTEDPSTDEEYIDLQNRKPKINANTSPNPIGSTATEKVSTSTTPIVSVTTSDSDLGHTTDEAIMSGNDGSNSGTVLAIILSSVGAVCLILLAVLLFVMRRRQKRFNYGQRCTPVSLDSYSMDNVSVYNSVRRKQLARSSKRSYGNPAFDDTTVSHPLNFQALVRFASTDEDVKKEFGEIPQVVAKMNELPEGCETKNRYANVIPLPETRVILTSQPCDETDATSDYINANFVTGPKGASNYYIACQAPMQTTVNDFWRMVWEQQSKVILMLTHLFENGIEKCVDYLPPSEVLDCHRLFGDFQVTLRKREVKDKYIISCLQLKNMVSNSWREVTHMWYSGWPEKGVPPEGNSLIAFLIEARSFIKLIQNNEHKESAECRGPRHNSSPVVVHCSPGTGRTGTVIACDIAIREFELKRIVDIPKIVSKIRRDRASAVQTVDQYLFIYKVITLYATKLTGGSLDSL